MLGEELWALLLVWTMVLKAVWIVTWVEVLVIRAMTRKPTTGTSVMTVAQMMWMPNVTEIAPEITRNIVAGPNIDDTNSDACTHTRQDKPRAALFHYIVSEQFPPITELDSAHVIFVYITVFTHE